MINYNGIIFRTIEELEEAMQSLPEEQKILLRNEFNGINNSPPTQSQEEKDLAKYQKRAAVKDLIISEMATENMSRVRAGIWTVSDLINLTQDPTLKLVLDDISTLSFELAAQKLQTANNPLLTSDIKNKWILKLRGHFYNE